ncbi:MAG: hypothetical protein ACK41D_09245 [Rubricoccaceae bacterium]
MLIAALAGALAACDMQSSSSAQQSQPLAAISPVDGRPIVTVTQDEFASGAGHLAKVRALVGSQSPALAPAVASKAVPGEHSILLKDLFASTSAKSDEVPSTHIRVTTPEGEVSEAVLTLERVPGTGNAAKSSGTTVVALDPDLFGSQDPDELGVVTVRATVRTGPDGLDREEDVIIDANGNILSPELSEASLYYVSATTFSFRENSGSPLCTGFESGGGGLLDVNICDPETAPPPPSPGSNQKFFDEAWFLALRGVQLSNKAESGSAEVVMHVQANDDYDTDFSGRWNYRFDKRLVVKLNVANLAAALASYCVRTPQQRDSLAVQFEAIRQALSGSQVTHNTQNQAADGILYRVPDVNDQGVLYPFLSMESVGARVANPSDVRRLDGFPLFELTSMYWRGLLVEKDNFGYGYDTHTRKGVGGDFTHAEDVNTFDMETGSYAMVNTRIRARRGGLTFSDDVLENSGFRRANIANVNRRLGNMPSFEAQISLFRYQFGKVRNRMVVAAGAPGA